MIAVVMPPRNALASTEALEDARFCQDDTYPLDSWDRDWCPLVGDDNRACPTLAKACENGAEPPSHSGRRGSRTRVPWHEERDEDRGGDEGNSGQPGESGRRPRNEDERQDARKLPSAPKNTPDSQEPIEPDDPFELPESMSLFAKILFFVLLAAATLGVGWLIWKNRVRGANHDEEEELVPTGSMEEPKAPSPNREVETDVVRLMRLAREAAKRGAYGEGIEHAYAAALRRLEGDGCIAMHTSRTNGDYVRGLRATPNLANPLGDIVRTVERVQFGRTTPDAALFERVVSLVMPLLNRTAMVMLWFAASWLIGCGTTPKQTTSLHGGEGPAGLSRVVRLVMNEGIEVGFRVTPLADIDESTATLMVFPAAVEALEESSEEVYDWVSNGGTLVLAGVFPNDDIVNAVAVVTELTDPQLQAENDFRWLSESDLRVPGGPALSVHQGTLFGSPALRRNNGDVYAASARHGAGEIIVFADDRLFSNISLAISNNADVVQGISIAGGGKVELCTDLTGAGANSPLESLHNARLTPVIIQLFIMLSLFLFWRGIAFGRLRDPPDHSRRRYAEHVKALGTQYLRAGASTYAAGAYARWALDRFRERVPRGRLRDLEELAEEIARRTGRSFNYVREVLLQAQAVIETVGPTSAHSTSRRGSQFGHSDAFVATTGPEQQLRLMGQLTDLLSALGRERFSRQ